MSEKTAEQIKAFYSELAKIGPSQDWEKILKVTKKSNALSLNATIISHFFLKLFLKFKIEI